MRVLNMLSVSISNEGNQIIGKFIADSYFFENNKYEYAFYLLRDGEKEKLQVRWYQNKMEATFDATDLFGLVYIKCFIRDKEIGNIRNFDSEKISINY